MKIQPEGLTIFIFAALSTAAGAQARMLCAPLPVEPLLTAPTLAPFTPPSFAPDGRLIAYVVTDNARNRKGTDLEVVHRTSVPWFGVAGDIWISGIATGERRNLTEEEGNNWSPSWSPDGEQLAFLSDRGAPTKSARHGCGSGSAARGSCARSLRPMFGRATTASTGRATVVRSWWRCFRTRSGMYHATCTDSNRSQGQNSFKDFRKTRENSVTPIASETGWLLDGQRWARGGDLGSGIPILQLPATLSNLGLNTVQ